MSSAQRPLPTPSDIKLIISDVDGTLLDSQHTLPPTSRTHVVLTRLRKTFPSLPIVVSTGKQYRATAGLRAQLDLWRFPACHLNGNVIYAPSGEILAQSALDAATVRRVLELARTRDASFFVYDHDVVWQLHRGAGDRDARWAQRLRAYGEDVRDADESVLARVGVIKMAVCQDEAALKETRASLENSFPPDAFAVVQALPFCAEFIPRANNKGTALLRLLEILRQQGCEIDARNVLAFGDGENDVSMFRVAGMSVAMANAMDAAKAAAVWTTDSNDDGGVGAFLERVFWPAEN